MSEIDLFGAARPPVRGRIPAGGDDGDATAWNLIRDPRPLDLFGAARPEPFEYALDFPAVVELAGLASRPDEGFIIQGDRRGDTLGDTVSSAGDVNGDGFDDVIVNATYAVDGYGYGGTSYVIFGKAGGFGTIDVGNLAPSDGFAIEDDFYDKGRDSVASAGDVNGDGFDDIIVGTPGAYGFGAGGEYEFGAGAAYIIFGKADGFETLDLRTLSPADGVFIAGDAIFDYGGSSVSSAGDINGDGFDDVVIGVPSGDDGGRYAGEAYVIFGRARPNPGTIDLTFLSPADGFIIQGDKTYDSAGGSVSLAGDINGDGFDDIIVGAQNAGASGKAYVIFGHAGGFGTPDATGRNVIDLAALAPADGFVIRGDGRVDLAGFSVGGGGDVNGDGFDDLIVAAPGNDDGGYDAGRVYVIFGKASGFGPIDLSNFTTADGVIIQGGAEDFIGFSVASAGDVNGDGFDDVIVGAPDGYGGTTGGEAYVVYGKADGFTTIDLTNLAVEDGFRIQGDRGGDSAGWSVASAGDVDNDGFDDMIVGAPGGDDGGDAAGEAYVLFGRAPTEAVVRTGAAGDQTIRGGDFDDTLRGKQGDDMLAGAGGRDKLFGGAGADNFLLASTDRADRDTILDFGRGADRIALDGDVFGLAEGALAPRRFVIGDAAQDANDRLIYDDATGKLFFDADGTGVEAQVLIVTLADTPTLAASDFIVI